MDAREILAPLMDHGEGGDAGVGALARRWDQGLLARMVDVSTGLLVVGSFGGAIYLAAAGGKNGSTCAPSNDDLPSELRGLLMAVPLVGLFLGGCLHSLNWMGEAGPLCAPSTVTLLHLCLAASLAAWLAGCVGRVSAGMVTASSVTFLGVATLIWAWSRGYIQSVVEKVMGRIGVMVESLGGRVGRGDRPVLE